MRSEMLNPSEDFFTPVQEINLGLQLQEIEVVETMDVPIDDFFTPIQDIVMEKFPEAVDDFFTPIQDFEPEIVEQETINPFTGEQIIQQSTRHTPLLPVNPFTAKAVSPVRTAKKVTEASTPIDTERAAAMQVFKKFFNTAREAGKAYEAQHMLVCTGKDGHTYVNIGNKQSIISDEKVEEKLMQSVMQNGTLYKKLTSKEPITVETEKELLTMAAKISDEVMGTAVSDYIIQAVDNLFEYEEFSLSNAESFRLIADQALSQHIHSAACGHGMQMGQTATFAEPSFAAFAPAYEVDSHADHNKLVVCENCPHQMVAHVHGDKGPTCPRCRKGPMKVAKKRKKS